VVITMPGGTEVLRVVERPEPRPGPDELLVDVRAAALNRADLPERRGRHPAPPNRPADVPGLEFAGRVVAVGERVREIAPGERVMGLAGGGAQAERVLVQAAGSGVGVVALQVAAAHERMERSANPGMIALTVGADP
jgi:NADPH:quinone reductase-like Zn-dependent oxidoreductase